MQVQRMEKPTFQVIGKLGGTQEGEGFIQRLWEDANAHFDQVQPLAKTNAKGELAGIWGAMSDPGLGFMPWEDGFTRGLYLAGVECRDGALPPEGWTKWTVPGFVYLKVESEGPQTFGAGLAYLEAHGLTLAGAVQDFTCPQTGKGYMLFPIEKL